MSSENSAAEIHCKARQQALRRARRPLPAGAGALNALVIHRGRALSPPLSCCLDNGVRAEAGRSIDRDQRCFTRQRSSTYPARPLAVPHQRGALQASVRGQLPDRRRGVLVNPKARLEVRRENVHRGVSFRKRRRAIGGGVRHRLSEKNRGAEEAHRSEHRGLSYAHRPEDPSCRNPVTCSPSWLRCR